MQSNKHLAATPTKIFTLLSSFYFIYYASVGIFLPFWNLYLEQQGFNKAQIGWLMSVLMLARIVAPYFWGAIADKTNKPVFIIRLAVVVEMLVWLAVLWFSPSFYTYILLMFVYSFYQNATVPLVESVTLFWLEDTQGNYGKIRLWGSIGFLVTAFGLGVIFDYVSMNYLPYCLLLLSILCLLLSGFIRQKPMEKTRKIASKTTTNKTTPTNKKITSKTTLTTEETHPNTAFFDNLKQRHIRWFYFAQFLLLFSQAPYYGFYSNYLAEFNYSTSKIGTLWVAALIAEIIMFSQSKKLLHRFSQHSLFIACFVITGLRWLTVAFFPTLFVVQMLAQTLHAFSFALFQAVAMQFIFKHLEHHEQSRAQALYMSCWGLGVALGTGITGYFWEATGGSFWFAAAGILIILFAVVFYFARPIEN